MDAENGLGSFFENDTVIKYPRNLSIGAMDDSELAYTFGHEIGIQLSCLGVNMNFAPVVDVNSNPDNPVIGSRSFGSDPKLVSRMGIAVARGLQDAGVIACAKHFPGHGDTHVDSHLELPLIPHDIEHLNEIELFPFGQLIKAGVKSIMIAHLEVPSLEAKKGLPSSLSHRIVTDLLQKKMQFGGLIITDALGMKAVANYAPPGELEVLALEAGVDILLCPVDPVKAIESIEAAEKQGRLQEEDINKKVLKILLEKQWIFQNAQKPPEKLDQILLSDTAKALQKKLSHSK
jgi:beta-glucosidase-like glycosyl hydrolase